MKGRGAPRPLAEWERNVTEAIGGAIEFWGFKANHGRVWALLYLRDRGMDATEIRQLLGLSKGAASMVTNELEGWGVVHRERLPGEGVWRFRAETALWEMIGRVIAEREAKMVDRIEGVLHQAERDARAGRATGGELERLERLEALAHSTRLAIYAFLTTARFDVRPMAGLLAGAAARRLRRRPRE